MRGRLGQIESNKQNEDGGPDRQHDGHQLDDPEQADIEEEEKKARGHDDEQINSESSAKVGDDPSYISSKKQEQVLNFQPQKMLAIQQQRERNLKENIDDIAIIRETMAEQDEEELTGAIDLEKHDLVNLQSEITTPNDESTLSKLADKRLGDATKNASQEQSVQAADPKLVEETQSTHEK